MLVDQRRGIDAATTAIIVIVHFLFIVGTEDGAAVGVGVGSGGKAGSFEDFVLSLFFGLVEYNKVTRKKK